MKKGSIFIFSFILLSPFYSGCRKLNAPVGRLVLAYFPDLLDSIKSVTIDGNTDTKIDLNILDYSDHPPCSNPQYFIELSPGNHAVSASNGILSWDLNISVGIDQCNSLIFTQDNATSGQGNGAIVFSNGGGSGFNRYDITVDALSVGSIKETVPFGSGVNTVTKTISAGLHNFVASSSSGYYFTDSINVFAGKSRQVELTRIGGFTNLSALPGTILVSFESQTYSNIQVYVNGQFIGTTTQIGSQIDVGTWNFDATFGFDNYGTSATPRCFMYTANTTDGLHNWSGTLCFVQQTSALPGGSQISLN